MKDADSSLKSVYNMKQYVLTILDGTSRGYKVTVTANFMVRDSDYISFYIGDDTSEGNLSASCPARRTVIESINELKINNETTG